MQTLSFKVPPEITAQCSDGGLTFSVVRPPRAESLWEVGINHEPLTSQLAEQRGYRLYNDTQRTTLEVPVFSIGYNYEVRIHDSRGSYTKNCTWICYRTPNVSVSPSSLSYWNQFSRPQRAERDEGNRESISVLMQLKKIKNSIALQSIRCKKSTQSNLCHLVFRTSTCQTFMEHLNLFWETPKLWRSRRPPPNAASSKHRTW